MKLDEQRAYGMLPVHMREGMRLYVELGVPPGDFLRAVLENKLYHAFARADIINRECLQRYAMFLESDLPAAAWGSAEEVNAWIDLGGLKGLREREGEDA